MTDKPGDLPSRAAGLLARVFNDKVRKEFIVPVRSIEKKGKKLRVLKFASPNEFAHFARTTPQNAGEYYDLRDANFKQANLDGADLRFADLSRARMNGASLHHALLEGATLDRCIAEDAHFIEADLRGIKARDAKLENVDFKGAKVTGADFSFSKLNRANFEKTDGARANFTSTSLSWAKMKDSNFIDSNLDQADTSGVWFDGSDFSRARLSNRQVEKAQKAPTQWTQVKNPATQISRDTSQAVKLRQIKKNSNGKPGPK